MPIERKLTRKHQTNSTQKTKKNKLNCSPNSSDNSFTCYSDNSLIKLRNLWNSRHPDKQIETNQSKEIWKKLNHYMNNICRSESCWLRQGFVKNNLDTELSRYTFAPKSPEKWKKNINEWLSSVDIEEVMKQYEHAYPCFEFLGPSPIDFDTKKLYDECVWEELCNFDLKKHLQHGKTKIGIVFNTDPHYLGGSHWIAMFVNIKKGYIYYFDSNGDKMPKEVKVLAERIQNQASELDIRLTIDSNYQKQHQKGDTECGMYVLYFIIQLITDRHDINYFKETTITDKDVEKLRHEYFNEDL
jgi:hypothetical protein